MAFGSTPASLGLTIELLTIEPLAIELLTVEPLAIEPCRSLRSMCAARQPLPMARLVRTSESPDDTAALGRRLARVLRPGDWVGLDGPLGAGKTLLVRSIAEALGVESSLVSSPTFVLINEYPAGGGQTLVHCDAYRSSGLGELDEAGLDALTGREIVLIEWADRIAHDLERPWARVRIEQVGEQARDIALEVPDDWLPREGAEVLLRERTRCPRTGVVVEPENPHWPFASERARLADLYDWFEEGHTITRPIDERDLDEE